jgi:thiosulfate reductase cytochrome b subunit
MRAALDTGEPAAPEGGDVITRHRLSTRIWHWVNVVVITVMLMSGLAIFNAHPRLYWGQYGANPDPAWLEIGSREGAGFLRVGEVVVPTGDVLGAPQGSRRVAFPGWATLPSYYSLATARLWHLTFAWIFAGAIVIYLIWSLFNRHLWRDVLPRRDELRPRRMGRVIADHARLRLPRGAEAARYNILQKAAYLVVLIGLIPGMILTGLTMSPAMDAAWPWLLDLFGGRQSARSLHFIFAFLLVAFFVVHIVMVILAGPWNELRSMITGRYRLPPDKEDRQ